MNEALTTTIVIPNYNGKKLLEKNLASVIASSPRTEIMVADDHSTDGSVEFLHKNFPNIIVVHNLGSQGFASNVNNAVHVALGDIVVLLNTDVAPEKNFLAFLLSHFENPKVFAVGCLENSYEGEVTVTRGRGLAIWQHGFYIHSRGEVAATDTAWVSGGSGAFRKVIWEELGGMDSLYNPFYWEDIDLSYRARKAGYLIKFESKSIVSHFHESGSIQTTYSAQQVKQIAYRNQFIFHWKNISLFNVLLAHFFWLPIVVVKAITHFDFAMIIGLFMAVIKLPIIYQHRKKQSVLWRLSDSELTINS